MLADFVQTQFCVVDVLPFVLYSSMLSCHAEVEDTCIDAGLDIQLHIRAAAAGSQDELDEGCIQAPLLRLHRFPREVQSSFMTFWYTPSDTLRPSARALSKTSDRFTPGLSFSRFSRTPRNASATPPFATFVCT